MPPPLAPDPERLVSLPRLCACLIVGLCCAIPATAAAQIMEHQPDCGAAKVAASGPTQGGARHGAWTFVHKPSNVVCAKGQYERGKKTGQWTYHPDRAAPRDSLAALVSPPEWTGQNPLAPVPMSQTVSYVKGRKHGLSVFRSEKPPHAVLMRVPYVHGQRHGVATSWGANGVKRGQAVYEKGRLSGPSTLWYPDGVMRKSSVFKADLKHGLERTWSKDATPLTQGSYKRGKKQGPWMECERPQGALLCSKGSYKKGQRAGTWTQRSPSAGAQVLLKQSYNKKGRPISVKAWRPDGTLKSSAVYTWRKREPQQVGTKTWWHPNGKKHRVQTTSPRPRGYMFDSKEWTPQGVLVRHERRTMSSKKGTRSRVRTWSPQGKLVSDERSP